MKAKKQTGLWAELWGSLNIHKLVDQEPACSRGWTQKVEEGRLLTCEWPPVSMLGGPWGRWDEQQCGGDLGKRGVSGAERAVEVKGSEEGRAETSVAGSRTLSMKSGSLFTWGGCGLGGVSFSGRGHLRLWENCWEGVSWREAEDREERWLRWAGLIQGSGPF